MQETLNYSYFPCHHILIFCSLHIVLFVSFSVLSCYWKYTSNSLLNFSKLGAQVHNYEFTWPDTLTMSSQLALLHCSNTLYWCFCFQKVARSLMLNLKVLKELKVKLKKIIYLLFTKLIVTQIERMKQMQMENGSIRNWSIRKRIQGKNINTHKRTHSLFWW